ncbi:MAG: hypothetical protein GAK28_01794 [Luteibacter sp.]|uniref:DUF488 domain-containing protein n=1 Tax=Luteibacter sp. TaxID=1886636 RepID=UPI00138058FD|nr:DUF488 domain-containing protein [Luteibacter sp.]KAF1007452.1 MAG: hypothetical protein GAK28_01794 [Luteibacter sp.]
MPHTVHIKRIYEAPAKGDGFRVLVDRLWPRGVKKEDAHYDLWLKDVAPSPGLRTWFGHRPEHWKVFRERYLAELAASSAPDILRTHLRTGDVTLLYAAKDEQHNHALVLAEYLGANGSALSHG